jgi:L-2-hydroxyglutarate oxidase LhgO
VTTDYQVAVIGGGILGLATALELLRRYPGTGLAVIEKEPALASHQTGHNSGVIHSGIYYRPGSLKARLCLEGSRQLIQFCRERGIPFDLPGKVIVATNSAESERLPGLLQRAQDNGLEGVEMIGPERLRELEPFVSGVRALHVPSTGVVDYKVVAEAYADEVRRFGGDIITSAALTKVERTNGVLRLHTIKANIKIKNLINCAGLHSDEVARLAGTHPSVRIIPFRGEYYTLQPERGHLVKTLIYPVPDPRFPFLGVHFTRRVGGEIEAGPNAVLAMSREGYRKADINVQDILGNLAYPGFWNMGLRYWNIGLAEAYRSFNKRAFLRDLQRLIPDVKEDDLAPGGSGVRAQAVDRSGNLLDDFSISESENAIHVLNAPSPAATASLAIGGHIADLAGQRFGL